jgi:hypothetical protein
MSETLLREVLSDHEAFDRVQNEAGLIVSIVMSVTFDEKAPPAPPSPSPPVETPPPVATAKE